MTELIFWLALGSFGYSYVLFPALVFLRAALRPRPHHDADVTPSISVVIAAHNEALDIPRKLDNLLSVDYPPDRLQIVIVSDGSTDGTAQLARERGAPNVVVLDLPRVGKGEALRAGVAAATGEALVFSDANSLFRPDALRMLVRPLADERVGGVAGNQLYFAGSGEATTVGEKSYWNFDRALKVAQSRAGNVIAATGAIYAIRRELFRPIPDGVTDDFYLSLAVVDAGRRLVFEPRAIAFETVAPSRALEYRRKVRIMTRGLRCVALIPRVLDPRRTGFYAVQLFSHKVLMRVMAVPLLLLLASSALLAPTHPIYGVALAGQLAFYGLGVTGLALATRRLGHLRLFALPAYFCLVQAASLHASWNLLRGRSLDRWEPSRSTGTAATHSPAADARTTGGQP